MNRNERAEDVLGAMLTEWLSKQGWINTYPPQNDEATALAYMNTLPTRAEPGFLVITIRIDDPEEA